MPEEVCRESALDSSASVPISSYIPGILAKTKRLNLRARDLVYQWWNTSICAPLFFAFKIINLQRRMFINASPYLAAIITCIYLPLSALICLRATLLSIAYAGIKQATLSPPNLTLWPLVGPDMQVDNKRSYKCNKNVNKNNIPFACLHPAKLHPQKHVDVCVCVCILMRRRFSVAFT